MDPAERGFISCWTVVQSSRPERFNQTPANENKGIMGTKNDYFVFFFVALTVKQKRSTIFHFIDINMKSCGTALQCIKVTCEMKS